MEKAITATNTIRCCTDHRGVVSLHNIEEENLRDVLSKKFKNSNDMLLYYDHYKRSYTIRRYPMSENIKIRKEDEIDAVIEITEDKKTTALAKPLEPLRHQLRIGKDKRAMKKIKKELELDAELGLTQTSEETAREALIHDIDKLTSSKDYYEITKKQLKKLFKINGLYLKYCLPFNFIERIKAIFQIFFGTPSCKILGLFTIASIVTLSVSLGNVSLTSGTPLKILFTLSILSTLSFGIAWMLTAFNVRYKDRPPISKDLMEAPTYGHDMQKLKEKYIHETRRFENDRVRIIKYSTIKLDLHIKPIKETQVKIPYGAKLKLKEAIDSRIFEDFVIAYPKFSIHNNSITIKEKVIPKIDVDPAICGITADDRFFMVVYWDIEKDIDRTAQKIKHFKKFKLKSI